MMTAHELFGFMPPELADRILEWTRAEDKPTYKAALQGVAQAKRVRPVFLERLPRKDRHTQMLQLFTRPSMEMVAANVLRTWLTKEQKEMLVTFLDALELKHEEGVLEDLPETMDDEKLRKGIDTILDKYPRDVVIVYLNAFNSMNETRWENLDTMLKEDERLQLV